MQLETKNYTVKEIVVKQDKRHATIKFVDGEFRSCKFEVSNRHDYTVDDWRFLNTVSTIIVGETLPENWSYEGMYSYTCMNGQKLKLLNHAGELL